MKKIKLFVSALFLSVSVFAIGVGDEVELAQFMNARGGPNFYRNANNFKGVLAKNTHGKVIQVKHFNSGNSAFLLEVLDGPMKGKTVWVHYNPEDPSLTLAKSDGKPATDVDSAATGTTTREVPVIRDPASVTVAKPAVSVPVIKTPPPPPPPPAEPPAVISKPAVAPQAAAPVKPAPVVRSAPVAPAPEDPEPEDPNSGGAGSGTPPAVAASKPSTVTTSASTSASDDVVATTVYTPQQAVADVLGEPLKFVGRGIPDPMLDDNGKVMIDGASQYCLFKNSKAYVIHQGCRPNTSQPISTLVIEVYSRNGGGIKFYLEGKSGNYNISEAGPDFSGTWRLDYQESPAITQDMSLQNFFDYYNKVQKKAAACSYGVSATSENHAATVICGGMSEPAGWREPTENFYNAPLKFKFKEAHDQIRFKSR